MSLKLIGVLLKYHVIFTLGVMLMTIGHGINAILCSLMVRIFSGFSSDIKIFLNIFKFNFYQMHSIFLKGMLNLGGM
jgi:hypothetical protein